MHATRTLDVQVPHRGDGQGFYRVWLEGPHALRVVSTFTRRSPSGGGTVPVFRPWATNSLVGRAAIAEARKKVAREREYGPEAVGLLRNAGAMRRDGRMDAEAEREFWKRAGALVAEVDGR